MVMEYIVMFISHIFKTTHYWLTVVTAPELHPEIDYPELAELIIPPLEAIPDLITKYLPAAAEALFWQTAKLAEIYLSVIIK